MRAALGSPERSGIEVLIETFMRKQLGLKAHAVTRVEETERYMIVHIDRLGRPITALRGLSAALPEGAQCAKAAGVARSVDAEIAVETALSPKASGMSPVRGPGGGFPLGRTVGADDLRAV